MENFITTSITLGLIISIPPLSLHVAQLVNFDMFIYGTSFEKFVIFAPWTCDICLLFPGRQSSVLGNVEEN